MHKGKLVLKLISVAVSKEKGKRKSLTVRNSLKKIPEEMEIVTKVSIGVKHRVYSCRKGLCMGTGREVCPSVHIGWGYVSVTVVVL